MTIQQFSIENTPVLIVSGTGSETRSVPIFRLNGDLEFQSLLEYVY